MAEQIIVLDEQKMLEKIVDLPSQLEKAWTSLWIKDLPVKAEINKVLICGMGGSGIAGQLASEMFVANPLPIFTWADYGLPGWVDEHTLIIAVSFSGDTEETVDAIKKGIEKKAPIILLTTGGKLKELAEINGLPLVEIGYDSVPRAALGWLYGSVLTILAKLKIIPLTEKDYFQAIDEVRRTVERKIFPPKAEELAMSLNNKVPVILAHPPLVAVAKRWVNQLNENSKTLAISAIVPELSHNFVSGLEFPVPEKLFVLFLESHHGFSRNVARKKILQKLFSEKEIPFTPLSVRANSLLSEQLLLTHFGDLLSYYLAGVYGIDPTPIPEIDKVKEGLKKV